MTGMSEKGVSIAIYTAVNMARVCMYTTLLLAGAAGKLGRVSGSVQAKFSLPNDLAPKTRLR